MRSSSLLLLVSFLFNECTNLRCAGSDCSGWPTGLVSWWKAEGTAADIAGLNAAQPRGGTAYGGGMVGQSFVLNGVDADLIVPASSSLDVGTSGGFTVEAWIRPVSVTQEQPLFEWSDASSFQTHLWLSVPRGAEPRVGSIYANLKNAFQDHRLFSDTGLVKPNTWQHVALTYDKTSGVAALYLDGTTVLQTNLPSFTPATSGDLALGVRPSGGGQGLRFAGSFDEPAVYSLALSAQEIRAIYLAGSAGKCTLPPGCVPTPQGLVGWWPGEGTAQDVLGRHSGTLLNGVTFATGLVGSSFKFDGVDDHLRIPDSADLRLTNALTVEAWVYPTAHGRPHEIVSKWELLYLDQCSYSTALASDGRAYIIASATGSAFAPAELYSTNTVPTNAWTHLCFTYNGAALAIYVNGVLDSIATYSRGIFPGTNDLVIGGYAGGAPFGEVGSPFAGAIDEPTVYNRALTSAEIAAVFAAGAAGKCGTSNPSCVTPPAGLVHWWRGETNTLDAVNNLGGILYGGTIFTAGKVGTGFYFDGVDDSITNSQPALTNIVDSFTYEFWAKPEAARTSTIEAISGTQGTSGQRYAIFPHNLFADQVGTGVSVGTNGVSVFEHGFAHVPALLVHETPITNWTHVAVVYSNRQPSLFLNGELVRTGLRSLRPSVPSTWLGETGLYTGRYGHYAGRLDEVSIYDRALSAAEVRAIYSAQENGKCVAALAPVITRHPADMTVGAGETVVLSVEAAGYQPLAYKWALNGADILGATNAALVLAKVTEAQAGSYRVRVANPYGIAESSNAVVVVLSAEVCATAPTNLVGWWPANGNAGDAQGLTHGYLVGNAGMVMGKVDRAFSFDGNGDAVWLTNPTNLHLQSFTLEMWVKRTSASIASYGSGGNGVLFGFGTAGYAVYLNSAGGLALSKLGVGDSWSPVGIPDTNWHHLAVTKAGTAVDFYIDGKRYSAPAILDPFTFAGPAAIGARGDNFDNSFFGLIDELSIYSRPLESSEIERIYAAGSNGKCSSTGLGPFIYAPPYSLSLAAGGTATFTVGASGTPPMTYQWKFQGQPVAGGNSSTLVLTNVQSSQAGYYTVHVTNAWGFAESGALLSVTTPPSTVRIAPVSVPSGTLLSVPVMLKASGKENALGFTVYFSTSRLMYHGLAATGITNASLMVNTNQVQWGRLGVLVSAPFGQSLSAGDQEVLKLFFSSTSSQFASTTAISFGDDPVARQVSDPLGTVLPSSFTGGTITLLQSQYEGDVAPRTNVDGKLTVADWVVLGRFAAKLEYPTNGYEFRRADCAPRSSLGDGEIGLTDWVQAGRYAALMDPMTPAGGPDQPAGLARASAPRKLTVGRQVRVLDANLLEGDSANVSVQLDSDGTENGLAFSLSFDPAALSYEIAEIGSGVPTGSALQINAGQAASGIIGVLVAAPPGTSFAAGPRQVLNVKLRAATATVGSQMLSLTDALIPREVSDAMAEPLHADFIAGTLTVHPAPSLEIGAEGGSLRLTWPVWATGFQLYSTSVFGQPDAWSPVDAIVGTANDECSVSMPVPGTTTFYRLQRK